MNIRSDDNPRPLRQARSAAVPLAVARREAQVVPLWPDKSRPKQAVGWHHTKGRISNALHRFLEAAAAFFMKRGAKRHPPDKSESPGAVVLEFCRPAKTPRRR